MGLAQKISAKIQLARLKRTGLDKLQGRLGARRGVTGISYHAISREFPGYPFTTSPEALEAHLKFLKQTFTIRRFSDAVEMLSNKGPAIPQKPVAFISFDDAYRDNLYAATPILENLEIPATLFAPKDLVQQESGSHMSEDELRDIADHPLWEVGSHGVTHNVLTAFAPSDIDRELADSKAWLEDLTGRAITSFAYPQGAISSYAVEQARSLYQYGATTDQCLSHEFDPLQVRRYCPTRVDDDLVEFARSLMIAPYEAFFSTPKGGKSPG